MQYDVFISYSHKDTEFASLICKSFELEKINCWMAPRNINPGQDWSSAIIDGINNAKIMIIVFSSNSNTSKQVVREVERAISKGIPIIPIKTQNIKLSNSMEYLISLSHWFDVSNDDLEKKLPELIAVTQSMLESIKKNKVLKIKVANQSEEKPKAKLKKIYFLIFLITIFGGIYISLVKFLKIDYSKYYGIVQNSDTSKSSQNFFETTDSSKLKNSFDQELKSFEKKIETTAEKPLSNEAKDKKKEDNSKIRKKNDEKQDKSKKSSENEFKNKNDSQKSKDDFDRFNIGSIRIEMKTMLATKSQVDFHFKIYDSKSDYLVFSDWLTKNGNIFKNKINKVAGGEGVWTKKAFKWPPVTNGNVGSFTISFTQEKTNGKKK